MNEKNTLFLTDVSFFVFQKVLENKKKNITIFRFKSSELIAFSNERKLIVGRIFISNFFLEYKKLYCSDETEIQVITYVVSEIKRNTKFRKSF